jgi:hypothetical protein
MVKSSYKKAHIAFGVRKNKMLFIDAPFPAGGFPFFYIIAHSMACSMKIYCEQARDDAENSSCDLCNVTKNDMR